MRSKMATFKVAFLWALVATFGLAFFALQCRSSNRLSDELVAKLAAADLWQQQLNEEGEKLRREIRVLHHDVEDYRNRLEEKSDSLSRSQNAEEECKASLAKLEGEQSRTDKAARDRADELEEQQQTLSQKLEKAESKIHMQRANLLNLQIQLNETSLNLSKAEAKVRQLLITCQDASRRQGVNESTTAAPVHNATAVTVPSRTASANTVLAAATDLVQNVTTVAALAAAIDNVVTTVAITANEHKGNNVTQAVSDRLAAFDDGEHIDVTEALGTSRHVADAKDIITKNVIVPPDDAEADGIDTNDEQLLPPEENEGGEERDEGSEGQGR